MFTCETSKKAMYIFASLISLELKTKKVHMALNVNSYCFKISMSLVCSTVSEGGEHFYNVLGQECSNCF